MNRRIGFDQALEQLAELAPTPGAPPLHAIAALRKRQQRRRLTKAVSAVAIVIGAGSITAVAAQNNSDSSIQVAREAAPAADPSTSSTPVAVEDLPCSNEDRRDALCPLTASGLAAWSSVQRTFDDKLTPVRLVGSQPSIALLDEGTNVYTFEAELTGGSMRPSVLINVSVPPTPEPTEPSIIYSPAFPPKFERGEGIVTLVQSSGTSITLRIWGGQNIASGETDETSIATTLTAVDRLVDTPFR